MQWFRLHNKLLNDPVVQGLSSDQFKVYINLLCYASSLNRGGYIGNVSDVSFALRETIENVTSCFNAFQGVGLIVTNVTDGETFQIPNWKKKQYESDSSTDRVKRHREKVKRSKTVTVTPPDTDTDTEQIQNKTLDHSANDLPSVLKKYVATSAHFDMFWSSGIRKVNKKKAQSLFNNLLKKEADKDLFTSRLVSDIEKRLNSNQLGFAEMHPTTYLNGERWNDEVINNEQENRPNGNTRPNRQTPAQRTRERARQWEAEQEGNVQALGGDAGGIRPPVEQPVRGGTDGDMGATIDGDFTRAD